MCTYVFCFFVFFSKWIHIHITHIHIIGNFTMHFLLLLNFLTCHTRHQHVLTHFHVCVNNLVWNLYCMHLLSQVFDILSLSLILYTCNVLWHMPRFLYCNYILTILIVIWEPSTKYENSGENKIQHCLAFPFFSIFASWFIAHRKRIEPFIMTCSFVYTYELFCKITKIDIFVHEMIVSCSSTTCLWFPYYSY